MAESILRFANVGKSYGSNQVLKGINMDVRPGEIHALIGENGAGKSTLMNILFGMPVIHDTGGFEGTVEIDGEDAHIMTPHDAMEKGIAMIHQELNYYPDMTVEANLYIARENTYFAGIVNRKENLRQVHSILSEYGIELNPNARMRELTIAKQQMVEIVRAIAFNAKIIIMDEPTTALTRKEVQALFRVILQLKEQGIAILFVSHKLDEVFEISERFTVFRSGKLTATGNTAELDNKKFTYYMTGREFEEKTFQPSGLSDEPLLEVRNLALPGSYEDISFSLRGGEILGVTGLLDSGRTELALSLFGIRPAQSGEIRIHGKPTVIKSPRAAIENGIGFVPEDRLSEGLFLSQSIADNIVISEIDDLTKKGLVDAQKTNEEIDCWVKELAIATPNPANAASTLSGGNQQRIVLAKWLACRPQILVLNGPTVGVDIGSKHDIHAILQSLAGKGMAVIIISDDLPELLENCSRIMILKDGRIVDELTADEASEKQILSKML